MVEMLDAGQRKDNIVITIIGASGHVGGKVAQELVESGHRVRVLGRDAGALDHLVEHGADVRIGDIADTTWLTAAPEGSDAVFAMVPSNPFTGQYSDDQDRLGESVCAALKNSEVRSVALSSLGADRPDAPGVIGALHLSTWRSRLRATSSCRTRT
ncbi:SDR family oxidoreductase [Rhodococcus sp. I2R]|uniref:SDR family oxidoreductase n=1 Tax=Rhodococcus sp. I2R TaxID=2855445 RepID=UPI001E28E4AF|nr:NAD(P)H-binding protein [Rhodococcus sp. I2R]MCC8927672.1 NAD(P)H-binding protein [Rhodococcus sp. I2R]